MEITNFTHKLRVKETQKPFISYPVIAARIDDVFDDWLVLIVRNGRFSWVKIGNDFYLIEEVEDQE